MGYENYYNQFYEMIKNQEEIIVQIETANKNLDEINTTTMVLTFCVILNITLGIVKKCFAVR